MLLLIQMTLVVFNALASWSRGRRIRGSGGEFTEHADRMVGRDSTRPNLVVLRSKAEYL